MKIGDLVKPASTALWNDTGIVIGTALFRGYNQATVRWSCGKVQFFDVDLLEVISESR